MPLSVPKLALARLLVAARYNFTTLVLALIVFSGCVVVARYSLAGLGHYLIVWNDYIVLHSCRMN